MDQQPSLPSDPLQPTSIPLNHPKIKPLLHRPSQDHQLNEANYQRSIKAHSKTLKTVKTDTNRSKNSSPRYIKEYRKILTSQDYLSKVGYSFNRHVPYEHAYFFSKIKSSSTLTSLDVHFSSNSQYRRPLQARLKNLAHLKNLTHFKIELDYYFFSETDAQTLFILFKSLQRLNNLKSLSLMFSFCKNFEKAKMDRLPKYLSHLKQLQSLELSFYKSMELTDQDIVCLASVLPKLPLLTQIKLDFRCLNMGTGSRRRIQGSTLIEIFHNIKALPEITLNLQNCEVISQESTDPLAEGLRQLHPLSLQKLSLQPNLNFQTKSLFELSQALRRFTSLKILDLNFACCEGLTNDGIPELGLALSCLPMLSSFSLKIYPTYQTDLVIKSIASGLTSLQNLVNLKLNFNGWPKCPPDQIQELSPSLATLTRLKFLEISFSKNQAAPDDVMEKLGESLRKLIQLKHLIINFGHAWRLTDKGMEALTNSIQELQGLSLLDLDFKANEGIDEKAVERISQVLRYLPSLYSLHLNFRECSKLRNKKDGFLSLFEALREMENIQIELKL